MTDDLSAVEALYTAALKLAPADRAAFLDEACREHPDRRAEVERLLAAHGAAGAFLEPNAAVPPTVSQVVGEVPTATWRGAAGTASFGAPPERGDSGAGLEPGAVIAGRYRLAERIGEGGMGAVWLAHQTEPVKRSVAVKVIKAGMDSRAVLARFEAERQALALMDHPNIAKVLDAGATADGRPFFVMELVKGTPITEFCDARRLGPRERLELFVSVCQAIQHAHQKGIIHRDIKPSNVLVALYDERPVVKVIDFGVAKATGPGAELGAHTGTGFGAVVGTPEYMSPEQATFNNLDIDTRTDVYALGVLLYELLAGAPPFSRRELERKGLLEMLRVVREEEPPKPSTKLSTADAKASISANRGTEPAKLAGLLRSELDWLVMKALEKDRGRRYGSANEFAADVQRYLAGEPVQAVPPSRGYRLKKFLKRNRGPVLATALVFAALVCGIVGTTWQAHVANGARREADQASVRESDERRRAERQTEVAFDRLYTSDIRLVQRLWDERQFEVARTLLDGLTPERTGGRDVRGFEWHLWAQRLGNPIRRVPFSDRSVQGVFGAASANGSRFAVGLGAPSRRCTVFDLRTGRELRSWSLDPKTEPTAIALSSNGTRVACGCGGNGRLRVWDVETGAEIFTAQADTEQVECVQFDSTGNRVVTAGLIGGVATVWDLTARKATAQYRGHKMCPSAAFSPDGELVVSAGHYDTVGGAKAGDRIKVWRADTGNEVHTFPTDENPYAVAFRPDGKQIAAFCSNSGVPPKSELMLWDLATRRKTSRSVPEFMTTFLQYSSNSRLIVGGGSTNWAGIGNAKVWDAWSGDELHSLEGEGGEVRGATFGPDCDRVYTFGGGRTMAEWDLVRQPWTRVCERVPGADNAMHEVAVSPNRRHTVAYTRGQLTVWDMVSGAIHRTTVTQEPFGTVLGYSHPDRVVTLGWHNRSMKAAAVVTTWDTTLWARSTSWACPQDGEKSRGTPLTAALSPNGQWVAVVFEDRRVGVYEVTSGRAVAQFAVPQSGQPSATLAAAAFSPDAKLLAVKIVGRVVVWDVAEKSQVATFGADDMDGVRCFAFIGNGRIVTGEANRLKVRELPSGREEFTVPGFGGTLYSLAVLPGSNRLVGLGGGTAQFQMGTSHPNIIRLWDTRSWDEVMSFPIGPAVGVATSPDGNRIVLWVGNSPRVWSGVREPQTPRKE